MLTIIAGCLVFLVLSSIDIFPKAYASNKEDLKLKNDMNYGLVPLNEDGSVTVKLDASSTLDVNLIEVDGWSVKNRSGQLLIYTEAY
ncbi:hypothetical protein [Myroides sp. LoEW2-1]|uniref:hypothetical protein n=1 Tax=Myroides sp. LoEW2-1 TaxID=2683192 RepID=UPI00132656BF|nr:hypothetical protein [Myroides sp. LoEW2-1]MVX34839.1 hypothetical protein [Myroides sp. LoEW2-1]